MHYLKKFISTLATMNYYSNCVGGLYDHLTPDYLQLVSGDTSKEVGKRNKTENNYPFDYWVEKSMATNVKAKMNNSYSSS